MRTAAYLWLACAFGVVCLLLAGKAHAGTYEFAGGASPQSFTGTAGAACVSFNTYRTAADTAAGVPGSTTPALRSCIDLGGQLQVMRLNKGNVVETHLVPCTAACGAVGSGSFTADQAGWYIGALCLAWALGFGGGTSHRAFTQLMEKATSG